jgi:hypothetical protein
MQTFVSSPLSVSSVLAAIKNLVMGPIDRLALATDVADVLGKRQAAKGHGGRNGRSGGIPEKLRFWHSAKAIRRFRRRRPLAAALWVLTDFLGSFRPSRMMASIRVLNQLT